MSDIAAQKILIDLGSTDIGDASLIISSFRGRQALSELYEYEVFIETNAEGGLAPDIIDSLLMQPLLIRYGADLGSELHGVFRSIEMLPMYPDRPTTYRGVLVPKLWRMTLTRRSRIWASGLSHPDIITAVLEEHGFEAGTHFNMDGLNATYPTPEYTVQYEETDFAFVTRLLEYHGIHYHFMQDPDSECAVFGDDNKAFKPVVDYERVPHQLRVAPDAVGGINELTRKTQPVTATVHLREYNWQTPRELLREAVDCDAVTGNGLMDFFGDHYAVADEGKRLAAIRSEELMVQRETFGAQSTIRQMIPGAKVEITGHPSPDFDQAYVVVGLEESMAAGGAEHRGGAGYACSLRLIKFDTTFRPARSVAWPRIAGIINAKVDGESRSTAAPIDDKGRYKLVFPFDTDASAGNGEGPAGASRWVRMAQPSAGNGYGIHFPLHIGTEVTVMHVNGDPDRPIIIGAVPNEETVSPVTSNNATHSQIRTGSGLLIEFDDDC